MHKPSNNITVWVAFQRFHLTIILCLKPAIWSNWDLIFHMISQNESSCSHFLVTYSYIIFIRSRKCHFIDLNLSYNPRMDITSLILTAECERLGPSYSV